MGARLMAQHIFSFLVFISVISLDKAKEEERDLVEDFWMKMSAQHVTALKRQPPF